MYSGGFLAVYEIVETRHRVRYAVAFQLGFTFGQLYVSVLGRYRLHWRIVQLACTAPTCVFLIAFL